MKITNWCRKLSAALVAGGLLAPCGVQAADLNTNLLSNPGFEMVDPASPGVYGAVKLLSWADGTRSAFAYGYSLGYDLGGPLAGGGTYFFTPNQSGGDGTNVEAPGVIAQSIDVSTGASAAAIAAGNARFNLSAFFTSYDLVPGDIGRIELRFVNSSNVGISSIMLSDPAPLAGWKQHSTSGPVPVGTARLLVSLYATPVAAGPDGYMDNLNLRLVPEATSVILAGLGLAAGGLIVRRRRNE
jgi:hypothetical protein